jgi:hypothetical protein
MRPSDGDRAARPRRLHDAKQGGGRVAGEKRRERSGAYRREAGVGEGSPARWRCSAAVQRLVWRGRVPLRRCFLDVLLRSNSHFLDALLRSNSVLAAMAAPSGEPGQQKGLG